MAIIPFDAALFGGASNNGQMIVEADAKHETAALISAVAQVLTGRSEAKARNGSGSLSLLGKLLGKK